VLSSVSAQVNGKGEVVVTAALSFVPAELLYFPSYRGML
jgi:hypothetical protein